MPETNSSIKLQAPGAGLPLPELYVAKVVFWLFRRKHTAEQLRLKFEEEQEKILELIEQFSPAEGATPVLVSRLRGMEDSSRNWSAYMTLDHLSIVNGGVAKSIKSLVHGEIPQRKLGTADVKPNPESGESSVDTFRRVCSIFMKSTSQTKDLETDVKFRHPWFGPLNARSWLAMASFHMRLHRKQIEQILAQIKH